MPGTSHLFRLKSLTRSFVTGQEKNIWDITFSETYVFINEEGKNRLNSKYVYHQSFLFHTQKSEDWI
jgi:hypothetical protein